MDAIGREGKQLKSIHTSYVFSKQRTSFPFSKGLLEVMLIPHLSVTNMERYLSFQEGQRLENNCISGSRAFTTLESELSKDIMQTADDICSETRSGVLLSQQNKRRTMFSYPSTFSLFIRSLASFLRALTPVTASSGEPKSAKSSRLLELFRSGSGCLVLGERHWSTYWFLTCRNSLSCFLCFFCSKEGTALDYFCRR